MALHSDDVVDDVKQIVKLGRAASYATVNAVMTATYWNIGRRIVEEEQLGEERAAYGARLLENLSRELTREYGAGYSKRYLAYFRKFYVTIPDYSILQTRLQNLRWSHILMCLRVEDETARRWYLESSASENWSVRALDRNITRNTTNVITSLPQSPLKVCTRRRRKRRC